MSERLTRPLPALKEEGGCAPRDAVSPEGRKGPEAGSPPEPPEGAPPVPWFEPREAPPTSDL